MVLFVELFVFFFFLCQSTLQLALGAGELFLELFEFLLVFGLHLSDQFGLVVFEAVFIRIVFICASDKSFL